MNSENNRNVAVTAHARCQQLRVLVAEHHTYFVVASHRRQIDQLLTLAGLSHHIVQNNQAVGIDGGRVLAPVLHHVRLLGHDRADHPGQPTFEDLPPWKVP